MNKYRLTHTNLLAWRNDAGYGITVKPAWSDPTMCRDKVVAYDLILNHCPTIDHDTIVRFVDHVFAA